MLILAISLVGAAIQYPTEVNETVALGGKNYRVWIKGRIGKVYSKAAVVKPTIETGDSMRAALNKLTGCTLDDAVWVAAHLEGVVNCPARQ